MTERPRWPHGRGIDSRDDDGHALRFLRIDPRAVASTARERGLAEGEVEVFAWSLDGSDDDVERWWSMLSDDERERANRFVRVADHRAYVVAHGALRRLLADYCGLAPNALRFARSGSGKPRLAASSGGDGLQFNLTHCQDAAIVAIALGVEPGVDLERERDLDVCELAARFLTPWERQVVAAAPAALRPATFLRTWVAKEAVTKAHGGGFGLGFDTFSIRFSVDGARASIHTLDPALGDASFVVRMLPVPDGYYAALATPQDVPVRLRSSVLLPSE